MKAVRFERYGGIEVLQVDDVPVPVPEAGEVLVQVKAAGINPGEAGVRQGSFHANYPATFPSGQGSDFSGVVTSVGDGVERCGVGDAVLGFTDARASQAEYVIAAAENVTRKPPEVPWEVAGALAIAGSTAYASVRAVALEPGDTVAVSAAAGGVGSIAVQLAKLAGADVVGIAGPANHEWLAGHGVLPVGYGPGLAQVLETVKIDAFIDAYGGGYVKLAVDLGVARERIQTIADFAARQLYGVKADGSFTARNAPVLAELAAHIAAGKLDVPVTTFPLSEVRAAYELLEQRHTRGKVALVP